MLLHGIVSFVRLFFIFFSLLFFHFLHFTLFLYIHQNQRQYSVDLAPFFSPLFIIPCICICTKSSVQYIQRFSEVMKIKKNMHKHNEINFPLIFYCNLQLQFFIVYPCQMLWVCNVYCSKYSVRVFVFVISRIKTIINVECSCDA